MLPIRSSRKSASFHRLSLESLESRLNPSWTIAPSSLSLSGVVPDLALSTTQISSTNSSITSTEVDWYSVTPTWSTTYLFEAGKTTGSSIDTVLALYGSNGKLITSNDDISRSNSNSQFNATLTAGSKYYLGVTNYTGEANGKYSLKVTGKLKDDTREENDTLATANNLGTFTSAAPTGTFSKLVMADVADYFKFTTTGTTNADAKASIQFKTAQGDLDIKLVNAAGTVLKTGVQSGDTESVALNGLAAGTYFLAVAGKNGAYQPDYTLSVNATQTVGTTPTPPPTPTPAKSDWTIAIYMTASDLADYAAEDINEMEKALASLPTTVKITVLYDQWSSQAFATGGGTQAAWKDTGRAVLSADTNTSSIKTSFTRLGEKNTGDPTVLKDFLNWTVTAAPANRYAVVYWNHGSGLDGSNYDDESNDNLTISEIASAMKSSTLKADLVAFDACLMGMVENAYALKDVTKVFAASQELEAGTGHDYTTVFNALKTNPAGVDAMALGRGMVTSFNAQYSGTGTLEDTYSVIATDKLAGLVTALKQFTTAISTTDLTVFRSAISTSTVYGEGDFPAYRDLGTIMQTVSAKTTGAVKTAAQAVITALDQAVFARTKDSRSSFGLSIYLPLASSESDSAYADHSAFAQLTGLGPLVGSLSA